MHSQAEDEDIEEAEIADEATAEGATETKDQTIGHLIRQTRKRDNQ
jgi:hypothetical protein